MWTTYFYLSALGSGGDRVSFHKVKVIYYVSDSSAYSGFTNMFSIAVVVKNNSSFQTKKIKNGAAQRI